MLSILAVHASAVARSDVGRSRSTNEDYFAIRLESNLFVVADGMGGHGNGEIASRLATLSVCETIEAPSRKSRPRNDGSKALGDELHRALELANRAVFKAVEKDGDLAGMGATIVAMMFGGEAAVIAHVGDSRAYRYRAGQLEQLTEDHTWVEQQVLAGELSPEDARTHPFRNIVTRALGGEAELAVDVGTHEFRRGDLFLLCTDGLTGVLDDREIAGILAEERTLDARCATLIDAANDGGGPDNVTALLVSFAEADSPSDSD